MTQIEVRQVMATCRFTGGPGREQEAADAWAFELGVYFQRGIGEPPTVEYRDHVYYCTGLIQTTHPSDRDNMHFDGPPNPPWTLDFCVHPRRRQYLLNFRDGKPGLWSGKPA